jgi:hypothetical protein
MEDVDEEELPEDDHVDDLGMVLQDAHGDCENDKEKAKLKCMIEDHRKLLYPNCKQGHKNLGTTLEMYFLNEHRGSRPLEMLRWETSMLCLIRHLRGC